MRIVYVEDNRPNQSLIERIAASGDHEVIGYATAEDAMHNFRYDRPDMLLVDVELAGPMTGLEMVTEMRRSGVDLPVIAITAVATADECVRAGCDAHFVKPIPVQEVFELIESYAARMG